MTQTLTQMLTTIQTAALLLAGVVSLYVFATKYSRRKLPPGPFPLPLLGSALWVVGRPLYKAFADLRRHYGDINCIKVGFKDVVVIHGYRNVQRALVSEGKKFSNRPDITWTQLTQRHGIFSTDGEFHSQQRSLVRQILTEVSWDQSSKAIARIQSISEELVEWLSAVEGKPVDPQIYVDTAVSNVNTEPIIGVKLKPSDDLMAALSRICMEIFIDAGAQNVNNYLPFLKSVPGDPTRFKALIKNASSAIGVVQEVVKSHKERAQGGMKREQMDFVDLYLQRMKDGENGCSEQQLVCIVTDLVAMGIEATATTLRWCLLLLCQHPDAQAKLQVEIDATINDDLPLMEHKKEMPYMCSFLAEVQRYVNLVTINLPHAATDDVTFMGYEIPKGTIVLPNLASVHYDSDTYPDPITFQPFRFVDDENNFSKPKQFLPYSGGARACLGKNLSEMEMFVFLSAILRKFSLKLASDVGEDRIGLIRYPSPYRIVFSSR